MFAGGRGRRPRQHLHAKRAGVSLVLNERHYWENVVACCYRHKTQTVLVCTRKKSASTNQKCFPVSDPRCGLTLSRRFCGRNLRFNRLPLVFVCSPLYTELVTEFLSLPNQGWRSLNSRVEKLARQSQWNKTVRKMVAE